MEAILGEADVARVKSPSSGRRTGTHPSNLQRPQQPPGAGSRSASYPRGRVSPVQARIKQGAWGWGWISERTERRIGMTRFMSSFFMEGPTMTAFVGLPWWKNVL